VSEQKLVLGRVKARGAHALIFFGLAALVVFLGSCGAKTSTTTAPTITVSCLPVQVTVLGTSQCTPNPQGLSNDLVNWSVSISNGGTGNAGSITSAGLYTAPAAVPSNTVTVTATSQAQSTVTGTQTLTIIAATTISTVTCVDSTGTTTLTVESGKDLSCTATTSAGATVAGVTWTISGKVTGAALGTINPIQGVYTAPLVPPAEQTVKITASTANNLSTVTVTATVIFGNAVLNGNYVFSTSGRLPTTGVPSGVFWARAGSFSAGNGALTGLAEDTNQGGSPNIVKTNRTFTGSYSIGPDGRGTMQFCEDTGSSCPSGSPSATAFFRIVVISPQQAQLIEFSSPTGSSTAGSATSTAGGEMVLQDASVSGAGNGNLSGIYSFNFSGVSSGATEESAAGVFAANGFGTISAGSGIAPFAPGEIDINNAGGNLNVTLPATIYSINTNGQGTVTLGKGPISTTGLSFSVYPVSSSRAKFIEIDQPSSGTTPDSILVGDAYKQQTSGTCGWGANALSGATVFETVGATSGVVLTDVGTFTASSLAVTGVSMDQNSGGTYSQPAGSPGDNYAIDMGGCGRGTLSIAGHSYVFYIISPSNAVLQEITSGTVAHGLLVPSQGGPFADATLTGSYAFMLAGTDAAGAAGNREDFLGQFTSPGTGTGLAGALDLNDFGNTQTGCVPLTTGCVAITNGTYLPSPAGSLRGTMSLPLTTTPSATTRNLVLYMVSPTLFYILDKDATGTAIGVINNQF
jgi:hypothetical protein